MFIRKIKVDKFKKLENFELEFPESKIMDLGKDKEMKLSVIIGENGTAKTTIFQLIINSFLPTGRIRETGDYEVNYMLNGNEYTKTGYYDNAEQSLNIVVSSYTPIDKLDLKKVKEASISIDKSNEIKITHPYSIQKTNVDSQGIKKLSTRIFKKYADNKFEEVYSILKYIGYEKREIYFELSEYQLKTTDRVVNKIGMLRDANNNFEYLKLNTNLEEKAQDYTYILDKLAMDIGVRSRSPFFNTKLNRALSKVSDNVRRNNYINNVEEHAIVESLFIMEKFLTLFKITKEFDSSYKNGKSKLLSLSAIQYYPDGKQQLLRDLEFLDIFSINLISDVWFENNFNEDPFPFSMLSSGELSMFIRFFDLHEYVKDNSIVLIDEPETHLHPKWIRGYIKTLIDLLGERKCHVIIATHSPLIISDVTKSCIIGLKKERYEIKQIKINDKTLGLNYDEVLSEIFELEDYKGEMINEYVDVVEKLLETDDIDKALKIYSQLANSEIKYQLFLKFKAYQESKGDRNV